MPQFNIPLTDAPQGRLDPAHLRYARPTTQTGLEALRAAGEIAHVKRSLELFRAQPTFESPEDLSVRLGEMLDHARTLSVS